MSEQKKAAPVYLQIREDGKVWAVLEDGTPLAHQAGVDTSSSATTGGVQAVITLHSAGWLPGLPDVVQIKAEAEAIKRRVREKQ